MKIFGSDKSSNFWSGFPNRLNTRSLDETNDILTLSRQENTWKKNMK